MKEFERDPGSRRRGWFHSAAPSPSQTAPCPLEQLVWSLQALALDGPDQRAVFPPFVVLGDELALAFDDAWRAATWQLHLNTAQRAAIEAVDKLLDEMSSRNARELWDADAVAHHADWVRLRELATDALAALGVPVAAPPPSLGATYVSADGPEDREER